MICCLTHPPSHLAFLSTIQTVNKRFITHYNAVESTCTDIFKRVLMDSIEDTSRLKMRSFYLNVSCTALYWKREIKGLIRDSWGWKLNELRNYTGLFPPTFKDIFPSWRSARRHTLDARGKLVKILQELCLTVPKHKRTSFKNRKRGEKKNMQSLDVMVGGETWERGAANSKESRRWVNFKRLR